MTDKNLQQQQTAYWNKLASKYLASTVISIDDFHYGPLLPGDSELRLLPDDLNGINCLEIGCGAAQNSIFLTSKGAKCTAVDISTELLKNAAKLAKQHNATVEFHSLPMEEINKLAPQKFELIHSSYALPFSSSPAMVIALAAQLLTPGGKLVFSTVHPLFSGEWLELDGVDGLFMTNYFNPPTDCRLDDDGNEVVRSNSYSVSQMSDWIIDAGLSIERILEPKPAINPPYHSNNWEELRPQMEKFPASIIFSAKKICAEGALLSNEG